MSSPSQRPAPPLPPAPTFLNNNSPVGTAPLALNTGLLGGAITTYTTTSLPLGADNLNCTYSGDAVYLASACNVVPIVVIGAASSTTLSAAPNPAYQGQTVTFSATTSSLTPDRHRHPSKLPNRYPDSDRPTLSQTGHPSAYGAALHRTLIAVAATLSLVAVVRVRAQAAPSPYSQPLRLIVFAGANGTETGLHSSRNAGITAGLDLGLLPAHRITPSIELRGTEPVRRGVVAGEQNFLAGLKVSTPLHRLQPYADLLVGRGEITYYGAGLEVPGKPIYYTLSHSTVFAGGGGLDLALDPAWSLKLDVQAQRYATPVTASGNIIAAAAVVGLSYRFNFNRRPKPQPDRPAPLPAPAPTPAAAPPPTN